MTVKVTLHHSVSICSVYIPPNYRLCQQEIENISQLTAPYILLGDFNAHSRLWGCHDTNRLGEVIEKVVENADLCILNDGSSTYLHPASGSFSAIDLSICSPSIFMDFKWEVYNDQCGSDHFPVFLTSTEPLPQERIPKWQLYKADWPKYNNLCSVHLTARNLLILKISY